MEYSGIGVWGATPEPKQYFEPCAIQTPPSQVSKNSFAALWSTVVLVFGAPPQNPNNNFSLVQFKHPHPRYPRTPLLPYGVQWYWCLGRHPRTQTILLALCNPNTPIPGIQEDPCCPMEYSGIGVWGATPEPKQHFEPCAIQTPHPRYPRTPLLPYGVQWYWCLGRHPRTQTTFVALCNSNTPVPGIQKSLCCAMEYSGIGVWGATPEPKQYF